MSKYIDEPLAISAYDADRIAQAVDMEVHNEYSGFYFGPYSKEAEWDFDTYYKIEGSDDCLFLRYH